MRVCLNLISLFSIMQTNNLERSYYKILTRRDKPNCRLQTLCQCQVIQRIKKVELKSKRNKLKSKLKKGEKEEKVSLKTR